MSDLVPDGSVGERMTEPRVPAAARLIEIGMAYARSYVLYFAAEFGVADRISGGERDADELARELDLDPPSFRRFLRALGGMGILSEIAPGRVTLTDLGQALRSNAPGAAHATIMTSGAGLRGPVWGELANSLRDGAPAFDRIYGKPLFEYLGERPELASLFSETMVGIHGKEPSAVAEAYDFSGTASLIDVGGASGNLLAHILARHTKVTGTLFDLPHVVGIAPAVLARFGVLERARIESGSFFENVPAGHDAYLLSHIIHDWTDAQCATILGNCRRAMKPDGRLLLVEMVLPEGDAPHPGKMLDIAMLVSTGGQERTEAEYSDLLARNGFRMTCVVPTASAASVIEAVPT